MRRYANKTFISSVGVVVSVVGIVVLLVTDQFTTEPNAPYYGSEHQEFMLMLLGGFVLCIIWCWITIASEHRSRRRPQESDSPSVTPALSVSPLYDHVVREEAELPEFLLEDAPRRLPGAGVPEEWSVDRKIPRRIAQDDRLRLI